MSTNPHRCTTTARVTYRGCAGRHRWCASSSARSNLHKRCEAEVQTYRHHKLTVALLVPGLARDDLCARVKTRGHAYHTPLATFVWSLADTALLHSGLEEHCEQHYVSIHTSQTSSPVLCGTSRQCIGIQTCHRVVVPALRCATSLVCVVCCTVESDRRSQRPNQHIIACTTTHRGTPCARPCRK